MLPLLCNGRSMGENQCYLRLVERCTEGCLWGIVCIACCRLVSYNALPRVSQLVLYVSFGSCIPVRKRAGEEVLHIRTSWWRAKLLISISFWRLLRWRRQLNSTYEYPPYRVPCCMYTSYILTHTVRCTQTRLVREKAKNNKICYIITDSVGWESMLYCLQSPIVTKKYNVSHCTSSSNGSREARKVRVSIKGT